MRATGRTWGRAWQQSIPSAMLQDGIIQYQCADPAACTGVAAVTGASGKSYPIQPGNYALGPAQLASRWIRRVLAPAGESLAYFQTYPQAE